MKKIILTEEEKNFLLNLHISKGYNTIIEQEEIINTTHDKSWDYKKVGNEYFTKRKNSNKWIKPTGSALEAIRTKVSFDSDKQQNNTEQPTQQQNNTEQPTQQQNNTEQPTQQEDNTTQSIKVTCDDVINAIAYRGNNDTSVLTPEKWFEYFGVDINKINNNSLITALNQLKKDSNNKQMKGYVFRDLKLPINIQSKKYGIKEESCCVYINKGTVFNYDIKLNSDDDEKPYADGLIRILIKKEDIQKQNC